MKLHTEDAAMRWTWMAVLALMTGCEAIDLEQLVKQHPPLTRFEVEPPGAHCAHGGQAVLTGLDRNGNGQLEDAEVTRTGYACTTVLVRQQAEPAGAHCEHGGQAVRTGADLDSDGELDASEVTGTEYVCATPIPGVLVRTRPVPPGEKCPRGGQVTHAGTDVDGDGTLSDTEITREVHGCDEPAPVLTRVRRLDSGPFVCQFNSSIVEAGVDLDRDGVFDDGELRAATRVCTDTSLVRVRMRVEEPGRRCTTGGTAVDAGPDTNEDGELGGDEVLGTAYVCEASSTYDGHYQVRGPEDLVALGAISRIRGGLTVWNTTVTSLALPGLVSVEGPVAIHGNEDLLRVDLTGLRFVGESLYVANNTRLDTLRIGGLESGSENAVLVAYDVGIIGNPRLTTLQTLQAVSPRRAFALADNDGLETPGSLPQVQELTGGVTISGNDALKELPVTSLGTVGGTLEIANNAALETLAGLERLRSVGGHLQLYGNNALTGTFGLWSLDSVGGSFAITDNPRLQYVGVTSLSRMGSLYLSRNLALETVEAMINLKTVDAGVVISENPKLTAVRDFPFVRGLSELQVLDNALLTDLSAFEQLAQVEHLTVVRNGALTSLSALRGVREVANLRVQENPELASLGLDGLVDVGGDFVMVDNVKLPQCQATALADAVHTGASRIIERNDESATCGN